MLKMKLGPTAIEDLMTILVPGWSRADYLLEYSVNSFFYDFILLRIIVDDKNEKSWDQKRFSSENFEYILDIVNAAKTGPESKMVDRVRYFRYLSKRIKSHKNIFIHFKKNL